jgi:hypothetical protein
MVGNQVPRVESALAPGLRLSIPIEGQAVARIAATGDGDQVALLVALRRRDVLVEVAGAGDELVALARSGVGEEAA